VNFWSFDPLLCWGLYQHGLGLVFLISFWSLAGQTVTVAGQHAGVGSIARRLAKIREDFPTWRRYLYFPTPLWLNPSDNALRAVPLIGLGFAALVLYGGAYSRWALLGCYLSYLTLDMPMGFVFPWDSLLFESTVLSLFLSGSHALPNLTALATPAPSLTWAYRLLVFRVMFGFGKQKFLGSRPKDLAYLRGFLLYQPLLSPAAWYGQKLPLPLLKAGVLFMFLAEIPLPFGAFFPGWPSALCAYATIALMLGIWLTGNFGYFSLLTIVACLPLFDAVTPARFALSQTFASGAPIITNLFVIVHTFGTDMVFPFSSWLAQSWSLWSSWYRLPRFVQPIFEFFRWMQPLRWLHPYGVFPPNNQPGAKIGLLPEVSWDGEHWHELEFKYAPSNERSRPHFLAPYHPRGDQAIVYDTFGLNANSLMSGLAGPWDPYYYASRAPAFEFCHKLLESTHNDLARTVDGQVHSTPPIASRITTVMLEPTSVAELRRTGRWWKRTYIGPHVPTHRRDPDYWSDAFGEPELWHFEAIFWRRRSRFHELMERSRQGTEDPLALAIWDQQLTAADVARFWDELMPLFETVDRTHFDSLPALVGTLNQRFDRRERRVFMRLLGRFSMILVARFEPQYLYRRWNPPLPAETYMHLWLLAHHIIAQGRDTYLHALAHPETWPTQLASMNNPSGLYLLSAFRFDDMCFEAQKLRLIDAVLHPHDHAAKRALAAKLQTQDLSSLPKLEQLLLRTLRRISGFFCVMGDLREGFRGPAFDRGFPELYPVFEELASGDIRVEHYTAPEAGRPLAPDLKSLRLPLQPTAAEPVPPLPTTS
jgi:hypothetical protein